MPFINFALRTPNTLNLAGHGHQHIHTCMHMYYAYIVTSTVLYSTVQYPCTDTCTCMYEYDTTIMPHYLSPSDSGLYEIELRRSCDHGRVGCWAQFISKYMHQSQSIIYIIMTPCSTIATPLPMKLYTFRITLARIIGRS